MDELKEMVGGKLDGRVIVDQRYAQFQHEDLTLNHPRGGEAQYLARPLMENYARYFQAYADEVLDNGGQDSFIDSVEDLAGAGGVATRAPVEFSNLRASGHPTVTQDGHEIFDRAPDQHRLSEEEIAELRRLHPTGWKTIHGKPVYVGL
jgi:hypothetical protein